MKSNTILLLVILFFVLGCTFNCTGMKENFSSKKKITNKCQKCFTDKIVSRGQEICKRPDSDFETIINDIWDNNCTEDCDYETDYLNEIKKTKNKQYLIDLVNKECAKYKII